MSDAEAGARAPRWMERAYAASSERTRPRAGHQCQEVPGTVGRARGPLGSFVAV